MRKLLRRALKSLERLDPERLHSLVQELVEDNEQLEVVLSSIPGGVMVTGPDHRVILINTPAKRLLPMTASDPLDRYPWEVLSSRPLAEYVRSALEEERSAERRDFPHQKRDRQVILSCGILPLVREGRIQGNFLYAEDVTDLRAEEARLRRAESLASLTTMAAGVAHEIKNPLASMGIHIQLIKRLLNAGLQDTEGMTSSLEVLEEEVTRLDAIVVDYLFAVRPTDLDPDVKDVNALIADMVQFLRFELEEAKVRVVLLLEETLPRVALDEPAMKQVFLNIIKNALAAMEGGGELKIQTRREGDQVLVAFSDTGSGVPEELHGKIFEPYFTTKDTGSGLGLTVVYKVVRDHGGEIQMDSRKNHGTVFKILLPIPQKERKLLTGGTS